MGIKDFAYIRCSTTKQVKDGNTIEVQLKGIQDYITKNNIEIPHGNWYIDGAQSAKNLNRREFKKLENIVKNGDAERIFIYKRDRLIRDVQDLYTIQNNFVVDKRVKVISVKDGEIAWHNANEEFMQVVYSAKDKLEITQASERTLDNLYMSALKGNYTIASIPIGARRCKRGDAKKAIEFPDENVKDIVFVFDYIADVKCSLQERVDYLNSIQHMAIKWTTHNLTRMITNPIYSGDFVTKRYKIENHTPGVITKEKQNRAIKNLYYKGQRNTYQYVFKDIIHCDTCDTILDQQSTKKRKRNGKGKIYLYYYCPACGYRVSESTVLSELEGRLDRRFMLQEHGKFLKEAVERKTRIKRLINFYNQMYVSGKLEFELAVGEIEKLKQDYKELKIWTDKYYKDNDVIVFSRMSYRAKRIYLESHVKYIKYNAKNLKFDIIYK
ncbi:recombinase family protein [Holdemania massiliensis]|uniref:recombinase family protein n=1 Tax=Holdemania massiliensis TaxID=1468449 RepID=UPI001F05B1C8|nr:recombinase family protein [Holdemania massiliensis]MCH1942409.1 recombinase family protein [Holdemania massiliensis]